LAIEHERAFNTNDDQLIHIGPITSDNIRVRIVGPLDMDALLPIPRDEMIIVRDAISSSM